MVVQTPRKAVKSARDQLADKLVSLVDGLNLSADVDGGLAIYLRVDEPGTGKTYTVNDYLVLEK